MKKLSYLLLIGFTVLLTACTPQTSETESIEELQAIISDQEIQLAELEAELVELHIQLTENEVPADPQDAPDLSWNRWTDTQAADTVLEHGLTVEEVRQNLLNNEAIIPLEGARHDVPARFDETSIYIGPSTALAYASDGHWEEQLFLSYQVENGVITWTVIAYTYEGELRIIN